MEQNAVDELNKAVYFNFNACLEPYMQAYPGTQWFHHQIVNSACDAVLATTPLADGWDWAFMYIPDWSR